MSLTQFIREPSPLRDFFAANFPRTTVLVRDLNAMLAASSPQATNLLQSELGVIGTALTYRAYLYFQPFMPESMMAYRGRIFLEVELISAKRRQERERLLETWSAAREIIAQTPSGELVPEDEERQVCRACLFLAYCERFAVASFDPERSPLYQALTKHRSAEGVLEAIGRPPLVEDLLRLSRAFYARWSPHFGCPVILNPAFEGSYLVGGADADWIIESTLMELQSGVKPIQLPFKCNPVPTLIELKSSAEPRPVTPQYLWQLLGYALLDFDDAYCIRAVGFDFARHNVTYAWPLEELAARLSGMERPIQAWRQAMQEVCERLSQWRRERGVMRLRFYRYRPQPHGGGQRGLTGEGLTVRPNRQVETFYIRAGRVVRSVVFRLSADEMDRLWALMEASGLAEASQAMHPTPGHTLYEIHWKDCRAYISEGSVPERLAPALEWLNRMLDERLGK